MNPRDHHTQDEPRSPEELLQELRSACQSAGVSDPELRRLLQEMIEEVGTGLDVERPEGPETPTLGDRVGELALEFELQHPAIAALLNQLTYSLSSMGI